MQVTYVSTSHWASNTRHPWRGLHTSIDIRGYFARMWMRKCKCANKTLNLVLKCRQSDVENRISNRELSRFRLHNISSIVAQPDGQSVSGMAQQLIILSHVVYQNKWQLIPNLGQAMMSWQKKLVCNKCIAFYNQFHDVSPMLTNRNKSFLRAHPSQLFIHSFKSFPNTHDSLYHSHHNCFFDIPVSLMSASSTAFTVTSCTLWKMAS